MPSFLLQVGISLNAKILACLGTAGSDDEPVQVQVLGGFCDGRIIKSIGNIE